MWLMFGKTFLVLRCFFYIVYNIYGVEFDNFFCYLFYSIGIFLFLGKNILSLVIIKIV